MEHVLVLVLGWARPWRNAVVRWKGGLKPWAQPGNLFSYILLQTFAFACFHLKWHSYMDSHRDSKTTKRWKQYSLVWIWHTLSSLHEQCYRPLVASVHAKIGMIVVSWSHIDRDNPRQMDFYSTYFCASGEQLILLAKRANRIWIYIYMYIYIYTCYPA